MAVSPVVKFYKKQTARIRVKFRDADKNLTDPSAVTLFVKDPSGNEDEYVYGSGSTVQKYATGIYYADIDLDENGDWRFSFLGEGAADAVAEGLIHAYSVYEGVD